MPKEKTTNLSENIKIQSHKGKGKQVHQKMKPYLVYQYLLENTDENHTNRNNRRSVTARKRAFPRNANAGGSENHSG